MLILRIEADSNRYRGMLILIEADPNRYRGMLMLRAGALNPLRKCL